MRQSISALVAMGFAAIAGAQAPPRDTLPTALVGTWEGTVALDSGSLGDGAPISLSIAKDGRVTGTVGDATLANGFFGRNPSLLSRLFGLGTPWMLNAALEGPLDSAKALRRERVTMPLELVDGELRGDFNAAGGGRLLSVRAALRKR